MTETFTDRIRRVRNFAVGPKQLVLNLADAVNDREFNISGNLFYVWDYHAGARSADYIEVRFNDRDEKPFRFMPGSGIILPFERFFITKPEGQTGYLTILYGDGAPTHLYPLDARTAALDVLTASRDTMQQIDTKIDNLTPNFDLPIPKGVVWADNDPAAGSIAWSSGAVVLGGTATDIAAGNTAHLYVYWVPGEAVFRSSSDPADVILDGGWMLAFNDSGAAVPTPAHKALHAGLLQAGTITADKYAQLRNTIVFNADDSLDAAHPLIIPFRVISETMAIVEARVSFSLLPFRAYSLQTGMAGGQQISSTTATNWDPMAETKNNSSLDRTGGAGSTTNSHSHKHNVSGYTQYAYGTDQHRHSISEWDSDTSNESHSHNVNSHDHATGQHTHPLDDRNADHQHNVVIPDHFHNFQYGIFEEGNAPTITYQVDNNDGQGYGDPSPGYTQAQADLSIKNQLSGTGWKYLKFNATQRCRLAVIVELKLDIVA